MKNTNDKTKEDFREDEEEETRERESFEDYFDLLQLRGTDFLKSNMHEIKLCIVYETLIYFLVNEEYEKCAQLRYIIDDYRKNRSTNLRRNHKPI